MYLPVSARRHLRFPSLKGFDLCLDRDILAAGRGPANPFPSLKGFDLCLDSSVGGRTVFAVYWVSIPQRVRPLPRPQEAGAKFLAEVLVSIPQRVRPLPRPGTGAAGGLLRRVSIPQRVRPLPRRPLLSQCPKVVSCFHPSKGSTSA